MSGSKVPDTLDALVTSWRALLPDTVDVVDGAPVSTTKPDALYVGFSDPGLPAVSVTDVLAGAAMTGQQESFDITSKIVVTRNSGSNATATPRDRAFEIFDLIIGGLTADKTVNGAVAMARLQSWDLAQPQITKGQQADITFVLHVDTFR